MAGCTVTILYRGVNKGVRLDFMFYPFMTGAADDCLIILQAVLAGIGFRPVTEGTLSPENGTMQEFSCLAR